MITSSFPRAPLLSYLLLVSAAVPAPAQVPAELEATFASDLRGERVHSQTL